jgi:hypothetical protein
MFKLIGTGSRRLQQFMARRWRPLLAGLLTAAAGLAAVELTPDVPSIFNPNESQFESETHFLVFTEGDAVGENATTAKAYYKAIDPNNVKPTFEDWLVKAGFIGNKSQWHASGAQKIACDLPGCDLPRRQPNGSLTYGDNIINTDSHAIVLNAADLGFVRNQFIRCVPNCNAPNPIIYTYLENYPVNPFSDSRTGGSGFPIKTGYPTEAEAKAAIESALNRPLGNLAGCNPAGADTLLGCSIQRIADVAFEWAPPPDNPTSSTRYGQLYAYVFDTSTGTPTETITVPAGLVGQHTPDVSTGTLNTVNAGDPFPPNLDFLGFKQHPGVCFVCHGGRPKNLTSSGVYPRQGNVNGFRFLPLDIRNLLFTSETGPDQPGLPISNAFTDRANQEAHIKSYNQAVLRTVKAKPQYDDENVLREPHLAEAIKGMYAGFPGDQKMTGKTQRDFIPNGWLEASHGGPAPAGSEKLYIDVIAPSCRSCHFNRELSLDFGTAANFDSYEEDILEMALKPYCDAGDPKPGKRPMALAHLTYQRMWEANAAPQILPSGEEGPHTLLDTAEQLAQHFGFGGLAAYCATVD